MTYRVTLSHRAKHALTDDLPEAVAAACFAFIAGPLAENPRRIGKRLLEPLSPLYSARRGEFRLIYDVRDEDVLVHVVSIKHRRDVYRR